MSGDQAKTIVHRHLQEMWRQGNVSHALDLCTPGLVQHDPATSSLASLDAYLAYLGDVRRAFPDLNLEIHDMIGEGDRVAVRWTFSGTHAAEIQGIPATGRAVRFDGQSSYIVRDGRIAEIFLSWDTMDYLRQLGALPAQRRLAGERTARA